MESTTNNTETVSDTVLDPTSTLTVAQPHPQGQIAATALAKPVSNFVNKSRLAHNMMQDLFWERKTIEDVCKEHNLTKEKLIIGFAVFGVQAMEIVEAKTMVCCPLPGYCF